MPEMICDPSLFRRIKQRQRFTKERQHYRRISYRAWHDLYLIALGEVA